MKIFFIDMNKFNLSDEILQTFLSERKFPSKNKENQHLYGRYLVDKVAKEIYKLDNTELEIINKKPRFKAGIIHFSISHSENIILAAFDENPVGADVEYMRERNFKELFARYNYKGADKETFYRFWTEYEAGIKLQGSPQNKFSKEIIKDFMLTVVGHFSDEVEIYELTNQGFIPY